MDQQSSFSPYGTPASQPTNLNSGRASATAIDILRRTKGWVRFLAVLGFITVGFMILGALSMFLGTGLAVSQSGNAALAGAPLAVVGGLYLIFAVFYLYPCIKLNQYASRIGSLLNSQSNIDLQAALDAQRSFWKFAGIIALIFVSLYALFFGLIILGGLSGAFGV